MTTNKQITSEREEVELLLPWYVTGKLDPADVALVEAYLASHTDMQANLHLIRAERSETAHLNQSDCPRPATSARSFVRRVSAGKNDNRLGLLSWFRNLVGVPITGAASWVGAAAALLIFAQAAAIVVLTQPNAVVGYREAAGIAQSPSPGAFVLVRFTASAPVSDVAALLEELGMTIAEGPNAGQLFKVRIGPASLSSASRKQQIGALSARADLVAFVTVTK